MSQMTIQQYEEATLVEFTTPSLMDPMELEQMASALYKLADELDKKQIVLDFEKVEYLASQAIGILVALNKKMSAMKKGQLVLCGVGARLMELLRITRLDRVLSIKPTQKDAIKALQ